MKQTKNKKVLWQIFFLVEAFVLLIALIMPVTPSKTGSDRSLAEYFILNPNYIEKVLFNFVFINLIVGLLALVVFIVWKSRRMNT